MLAWPQQAVEEGIKRLGEAGILEWMHYVIPQTHQRMVFLRRAKRMLHGPRPSGIC